MIQRKQTLFLLAVAIIAILMFFVPFFKYTSDTRNGYFNLLSFKSVPNSIYLLILDITIVLFSIIVIFLYKNRVLQYKLSNLLMLLNVFITGLAFVLRFNDNITEVQVTFWAFLPIIGAIFAFLAAHFIKKDEQLVRSADRIR